MKSFTKEEITKLLVSGAIDGKEFTRLMDELELGLNKVVSAGEKEQRLRTLRKGRYVGDRDKILEGHGAKSIQLDSRNDLVALHSGSTRLIHEFTELVSSEVLVDEERAMHTDGAGLLARAALGGLLTGGVGAIVLALGAKKKEVRSIKTVKLKLTLSSAGTKLLDFVIQLYPYGWTTPEEAIRKAAEWHEMLSSGIRKAADPKRSPAAVSGGASLAGELAKLGELRQAGLLSEEEFRAAKAALL